MAVRAAAVGGGQAQIAGGLAAAGAAGGAYTAFADKDDAGAAETTTGTAPDGFVHTGLLHRFGELNRAKVNVKAGKEPWLSGWNRLLANSRAQSSWKARPLTNVVRGGEGQNYTRLMNDIHAAYQNALRWRIAGTKDHGDTARDILNAWSGTLKSVTGNADRYLAAGLYGYQFANAAELMRGYPGFDLEQCKSMMLKVFYPLSDRFLKEHNGACVSNYWANWDLCAMNSILAIGILCDDRAKFDQAVDYFRNGSGNGSIKKAVPFLHPGGLGQWQESGRDQGHSLMGIGLMGAFCETAWSQGVDLYGYDDNRFLKGAEYVARYNLGYDVPFTRYTWGTGTKCAYREQTVVSSIGRGQARPVWAMVHNHYARRRRISTPYLAEMVRKSGAEGGGGDYGTNSGGFDQLGFGTLLYSR
ncbi:alginate lyase family protein [Streptomyces blattellae]|uniref:alginate lyase family protein n=1 Tax=Streptomyces blattellae TaxID=2569855 RepID=UPI0012B847AC|nr:alginate lyase family protein [Streptomyces blattellae]